MNTFNHLIVYFPMIWITGWIIFAVKSKSMYPKDGTLFELCLNFVEACAIGISASIVSGIVIVIVFKIFTIPFMVTCN